MELDSTNLYVVPLLVIGVKVIGFGPAAERDKIAFALLLEALTVNVVTPLSLVCVALNIVIVSLGTAEVAAGAELDVVVTSVVAIVLDGAALVGAAVGAEGGGHDLGTGGDAPGQGLN